MGVTFKNIQFTELTGETAPVVFQPLFNGKDMSGWMTHPSEKSIWEVKDGILIGRGQTGYLYTTRGDYENFHFRVEARINAAGDSGQFFRARFPISNLRQGYEAQITLRSAQRTGSLCDLVKVSEALHQPDEWFTQEVIAEGDHIRILVNGKTVVDTHDKSYRSGHLALQMWSAGTVVQFRKVEVAELPRFANLALTRTIHGVDSRGLQAWLDRARSDGFRPVFMNGYAVGGAPQFAGIAVADETPWEAGHGLTFAELQKHFTDRTPAGHRFVCISGYPEGNTTHFAFVTVRNDAKVRVAARFNSTAEVRAKNVEDYKKNGLHTVYLSGYPNVKDWRFAAVYTNEPPQESVAECDLSEERLRSDVAQWIKEGLRPIGVGGYQAGDRTLFCYVAVKNPARTNWIERHNLTPEQYQKEEAHWTAQGYRPLTISGYRWQEMLHYAGVWVKDQP
jgi:hypothetical protein